MFYRRSASEPRNANRKMETKGKARQPLLGTKGPAKKLLRIMIREQIKVKMDSKKIPKTLRKLNKPEKPEARTIIKNCLKAEKHQPRQGHQMLRDLRVLESLQSPVSIRMFLSRTDLTSTLTMVKSRTELNLRNMERAL